MVEPEKPFACSISDCRMTFTNEDHLNVHTKKHDMVLQLGLEQKSAFVADQTPTPTRFIKNCEEVGLFQDLQNVTINPFDEGFKKAIENKQGILSLETIAASTPSPDDVLHTPVVFPLDDPLTLLQSHRSGISRSSSDESSAKAYEALAKLTNEVTINRLEQITVKEIDISKGNTQNSVETKNKDIPVIITCDNKTNTDDGKFLMPDKVPLLSQKSLDFVVDSLTNEAKVMEEKVALKSKTLNAPFYKQLGNKFVRVITKSNTQRIKPRILAKKEENDKALGDYEVFIKLPNGKQVRMKPVEEQKEVNTKEIIRNNILKKTPFINRPQIRKVIRKPKVIANVVKIPTGTLIPVTLVNQEGAPLSNDDLSKVPITKIDDVTALTKIVPKVVAKPVTTVTITKHVNAPAQGIAKGTLVPIINTPKISNVISLADTVKTNKTSDKEVSTISNGEINQNGGTEAVSSQATAEHRSAEDSDDDCVIKEVTNNPEIAKRTKIELESKSAASRRYRERLKSSMQAQAEENKRLREANQKLLAEQAVLKLLITEHIKSCPCGEDLRLLMQANIKVVDK